MTTISRLKPSSPPPLQAAQTRLAAARRGLLNKKLSRKARRALAYQVRLLAWEVEALTSGK